MTIEVLFFAILRERAGRASATITVAPGATVATLLERIATIHPALGPLAGRVQVAVNRQICPGEHALEDGDEVALIPPVSGGSAPRKIVLSADPLSLAEVTAAVEGPSQGAIATFTGHVRRRGAVPDVVRLEYEAYEPMAREVLAAIAVEIETATDGVQIAIHHRLGALAVGEAAVIIAASSPHRAEAFEACRAAIEALKQRAPIWKKEIGESGAVWVGWGP